MPFRYSSSNPTLERLRSALAVASRVAAPGLHILSAFASRFANRRFLFAIGCVAIISGKLIHIYSHLTALSTREVLRWGSSFFAQDTAVLIFLRFLLDTQIFSIRWLRIGLTIIASLSVLCFLTLATINNAFFIVAGSEPHWRNVGLASEASSWKLAVTGLVTFLIVLAINIGISWIAQDVIYYLAGLALNILLAPFVLLWNRLPFRDRLGLNIKYANVPQQDFDGAELLGKEDDDVDSSGSSILSENPRGSKLAIGMYAIVGLSLLMQVVSSILRPRESAMTFMSWTLPLLPFVDFAGSSPILAGLLPYYGNSINWGWDNRTAVVEPIQWEWLTKDAPLPGFEDWYDDQRHYRASEDPLKISNLDSDILPGLREKLSNVTIKHIMIVKLESTRKDAFPVKHDGIFYELALESSSNGSLTSEAEQRFANLTPTANFITGDYNDGFPHKSTKRRGGINVNNCHTTATYTLKSLVGTLCGLSPLVADFNAEVSHHIYQPCLSHILGAFNQSLGANKKPSSDDYTTQNWKSYFMMSVTGGFDRQGDLMAQVGFPENNTIYKEYLISDAAKFGAVKLDDINYYGMPEIAIEDYIRDAFVTAKEKNERVFLTHLTSTTHHPFGLPENETHVAMNSEGSVKLENVSNYLNAIGYVDSWLKKILDILEEQGVADETLIVFVGDHGLSVPENDGITPYYQSNIGNLHVPLVFSHPSLPPIDVNEAAVSYQILPTILDLLLETGSLAESQKTIAKDLIQNYEGQSLLRPLIDYNKKTKQPNWTFTVMNPGRATVAVRDARKPHWKLMVPIIENTEWRFSDNIEDPREADPLIAFGFTSFLKKLEEEKGIEYAQWAEQGAFVTRWWVEDNSRRWHYDP